MNVNLTEIILLATPRPLTLDEVKEIIAILSRALGPKLANVTGKVVVVSVNRLLGIIN